MPQSPGTLRDRQRLWRPAVTKSVPRSLAPLCTLESELDTKEPRVSVQGEKCDQLLQRTAWSKAASRPHTFEVWKVLPIPEGASAPPVPFPVFSSF